MREIKKNELGEFCVTGEFDIACSVSADAEAKKNKESVGVVLRFKMVNTPLQDIIQSSLKDKRINWQTKGRSKTETLKPHQVILLDYRGGRQSSDPKDAFISLLASMAPEERAKQIAELQAMK